MGTASGLADTHAHGSPTHAGDLLRRLLVLVAAVVAANRVAALTLTGQPRLVVLNVLTLVMPCVATGVSAARARLMTGRDRTHLALMAAATAVWAAGQAYWLFAEVVRASGLPFPSLADVGYLAFLPVAALGLVTAPSGRSHRTTMLRHALDAAAIASSLIFVAWATVLHPVLESYSGGKASALAVAIAYPVGDGVLLAVVLVLLLDARPPWRTSLTLYATALALLTVTDSGFAYLTAVDSYATGSVIDSGWQIAWVLLAAGAWHIPRISITQEGAVEPPTRATNVAPTMTFLAAMAAAIYLSAVRNEDLSHHPFLGVLASLVFVASVLRSVVARSEGAAYASQLSTASAELARLNEQHRMALDAAAMGTWEWDTAINRVVATPRLAELLGIAGADEAISWHDLITQIHPDDRGRVEDLLATLSPALPEVDFGFRVGEREDAIRVQVRGRASFGDDGTPLQISGVAFDVTEKWLAAERLRRREARMAGLASLGARSHQARNADQVLRDVTSSLVALIPTIETCALWRLGPDLETGAQALHLVTLAPGPAQPDAVTRPLEPGSPAERAVLQRAVVVQEGANPATSVTQPSRQTVAPAEVVLAVLGTHDVWGVLSAHEIDHTHHLTAHDLSLLQEAANIASTAIIRQESEMALWHEARHDHLTAIPNRTHLLERLAEVLPVDDRSVLGVMMLDLDDFKDVNDRYGHETGDELLVEIARRLRESVRPPDLVARLGGDEFAVVIGDAADRDHVERVAARILKSLTQPVDLAAGVLHPQASLGWVTTRDCEPAATALLRSADLAMYGAKRAGKNRAMHFDASMFTAIANVVTLGEELRGALNRNELVLYYQPQVDLRSRRISGAEALIRWDHPDHGLLPPSAFLPIADQKGLIQPITAWAIREACRWAAHAARGEGPPITISVNVTASDLEGDALPAIVADALSATGLDRSRLCLEVTEAGLVTEMPTVTATLSALRAMGVAMAIDDFGTGYSSLTQLKRLPVDFVKIDQGFVDGLGTELDDSAMVAGIIRLAHSLSLGVIAEGVETTRQLGVLEELGCEFAQGYLIGRPRPPADPLPYHHVSDLLRTPAPMDAGGQPRLAPLSVLIADDLDADRRLLQRSLQRSGRFTVIAEAADGLEAVRLATQLEPDVVLLDLDMPVMDGWAALRVIRAEVPTTAVVVVTGHASDVTTRAAAQAGALACITKGSDDVVPELLKVLEVSR